MPVKGFKSITMNVKVINELNLDTEKVDICLKKILKEKEALQKFASQITKCPKIVRVYTTPFMEKKK